MIEAINHIVVNIVVIIIITTILDLLMPEGRMQSLVKLVMGMFVVVSMLAPVTSILHQEHFLDAWVLELPQEQQMDSIMAQGEEMRMEQTKAMWQEYQKKLNGQISAILLLMPEVERCFVSTQVDESNGALMGVEIGVKGQQQGLADKIQQVISGYYGLRAEQIQIQWLEDEE